MNIDIPMSIEGILNFVNSRLDEEKKLDFFRRKLDTTGVPLRRLYRLRFESINPISLAFVEDEGVPYINGEHISDNLKTHNDVFGALFHAHHPANSQARQVSNAITGETKILNTSSFSDYYISRSLPNSVFKNNALELQISPGQFGKCKKVSLLEAFYPLINQELIHLHNDYKALDVAAGKKTTYPGAAFFIDFNSLATFGDEGNQFFIDLLKEYPWQLDNLPFLGTDRWNEVLYLHEAIEFMGEASFELLNLKEKRKAKSEQISPSFHEYLAQLYKDSFEVPTDKKPTLRRNYSPRLDGHFIPHSSLFEKVLFRYLTFSLGKGYSQANIKGAGHTFTLKQGGDRVESLETRIQLAPDSQKNVSMVHIDLEDKLETAHLLNAIRHSGDEILDAAIDKGEEWQRFSRISSIVPELLGKNTKPYELWYKRLDKRQYETLANMVKDLVIQRIDTLAIRIRKNLSYFDLLGILFTYQALRKGQEGQLKGLNFMTKDLKPYKLANQDELTAPEFAFLLGATAGLAIKETRNFQSLRTKFLKLPRYEDVYNELNGVIRAYFNESKHQTLVAKWMKALAQNLDLVQNNRPMTPEEKFSYTAGLLSEAWQKEKEDSKIVAENEH